MKKVKNLVGKWVTVQWEEFVNGKWQYTRKKDYGILVSMCGNEGTFFSTKTKKLWDINLSQIVKVGFVARVGMFSGL